MGETLTIERRGTAPARRLDSIDILRGVVMVVMALDHVRDFFGSTGFDPTDLARTTPAYFFTRWVTHFAAPTFMLLTGTAAYLQLARGKTKRELARFLLTRGAFLVALELTVVAVAWVFGWPFYSVSGLVIWALGWCMIALAGLIFLPTAAIAGVGIGMVALHDLTDGIAPEAFGRMAWLWTVLHVPGDVTPTFTILYPLIPWIGVVGLGFVLGRIYDLDAARRQRLLLRLGLALSAAFVVLRLSNVYGDPSPWALQKDTLTTIMSVLDCTKYPPSLLFLLMTLGPALVALALFERASGVFAQFFVVFGRAPMFYYIAHLYLIHALAIVAAWAGGHDASGWYGPTYYTNDIWAWDLWVVYLVWIGVVLTLWNACSWYGAFKKRHRDWAWLSYV